MSNLSEYDVRESEKYRIMYDQRNRLSPGLAGYLTFAGVALFLSGIFFGGGEGETNPMFLAGIGLCMFLGGGVYWLHCKETDKRLSQELRSIERHFVAKNMRIDSLGRVSDI